VISVLEAANGALAAFGTPALSGIVPDLVAKANLQRANALLASTQNAARILGPTAAGLLVVGAGGGWAIALDALSFVVAAGFFARLRAATPVPARRARLTADIRQGVADGERLRRRARLLGLGHCLGHRAAAARTPPRALPRGLPGRPAFLCGDPGR
jgi:MFS family permease